MDFLNDPLLQRWLNPHYLNPKLLSKYATQCHRNRPFPHLVLPNFLKEEFADDLLLALPEEKFELKQADLFQFKQTADLVSTEIPLLKEFHTLLSSSAFITLISFLSSSVLKLDKINLSASLYEDSDHLLCHDDVLEGRKVAFFYYLSNLELEDGGALSLFSTSRAKPDKVDCKILPKFNTFAFFVVSRRSFHQVEEMLTNKQRYALSGWFHVN